MADALIYDGSETLSVTKEQADSLVFFGFAAYSPEDGPNGIMYRPAGDYSLADCEGALGLNEEIDATQVDLEEIHEWLTKVEPA